MENKKKYELINNPVQSDTIEYNGNIIFTNNKSKSYIKSLVNDNNLIKKIKIKSMEFFDKMEKIHIDGKQIYQIPNSVEYLEINIVLFQENNKILLPEKLKVLKMTFFSDNRNYDYEYRIYKEKFINKHKLNYPNELFYASYNSYFNSNVDNLPSSIEILIFGRYFNQPLDYLGSKLKLLCLGDEFAQPLDNLPNSLEVLMLSNYYSHELNNLPFGLKELMIFSIGEIDLMNDENDISHMNIIIKEIFKISDLEDYKNKRKIYLLENYKTNRNLILPKEILSIKNLPPNLEYIYLGENIRHEIDNFPKKIKYLKLGACDNILLNKLYDLPKLNILSLNDYYLDKINLFDEFRTTIPKLFVVFPTYIVIHSQVSVITRKIIEIADNTFHNIFRSKLMFRENIIIKKNTPR